MDDRVTASEGAVTTAIVHAADGLRFVAAAVCPEVVLTHLADYVCERCDEVLGPDAARQVRALLLDGQPRSAIALYFDCTGKRWDQEHLELVTVGDGEPWIADRGRMADERR